MPAERKTNPSADLTRPVGSREGMYRPVGSSRSTSEMVSGTVDSWYKKKRLARSRRRRAAGRSALMIQTDSERGIPQI